MVAEAIQRVTERKRIGLIDLSAIFRSAWHASEHDEVSAAYNKTLAAVVAAAAGYDHVAVCCDRPPYRRRDISKDYKAHREQAPAAMYEQARAVEKALADDGYCIIGSQGFEADDVIATLAKWAAAQGHEVVIHSADKDLMQLVSDSVSMVSTATGQKYGPEDVRKKWGVGPELIADLLALTGDKSDNIAGIDGVGPKTAAKWLTEIGPLEAILSQPDRLPERFREAVKNSRDVISTSWRLVQLMDAPINPEDIMQTREAKPAQNIEDAYTFDAEPEVIPAPQPRPQPVKAAPVAEPEPEPAHVVEAPRQAAEPAPVQQTQALAPVEWERSLEPRDPKQAWGIASALYKSRMFGDYPNPEAILAIVMTGRALGMDTVASLRGFHLIKGKACPSAQLLVGLVKRHSACEWFRLVESTDKVATWETKRRDEPKPTTMSFTIEDAVSAALIGNDQWKKRPKTMLRWRAAVELARVVYPDITSGLYTAEEMDEG